MLAIPARVIATSFALICFAGTLCVGMYHGNPWGSIMISAVLVTAIALCIGHIVGSIALRSVNDYIAGHRESNPIPDEAQSENDQPRAAAG